jgi:hypothetical protein
MRFGKPRAGISGGARIRSRRVGLFWAEMERAAWTDERLDDLADRVERGFDRVDRDIRDLRVDMTAQIEALRQTMIRIGGGMLLGSISVLAAILARGA